MNIIRRILRKIRGSKSQPQPDHAPVTIKVSLGELNRFLYQKRMIERVDGISGDIVECGVGNGKTLMYWAFLVLDEGVKRNIWGFDSFEGFPEPSESDESPRKPQKGQWGNVSIQKVQNILLQSGVSAEFVRSQITLIKGFFENSLHKYTGENIALLHLDCDLYQSYLDTLNILYPKVVPGGVIALDEYMGTAEHANYPGAKKAIDEYFQKIPVDIVRDPKFGKYYIVKPTSHTSK